jgi:hypothetical protein
MISVTSFPDKNQFTFTRHYKKSGFTFCNYKINSCTKVHEPPPYATSVFFIYLFYFYPQPHDMFRPILRPSSGVILTSTIYWSCVRWRLMNFCDTRATGCWTTELRLSFSYNIQHLFMFQTQFHVFSNSRMRANEALTKARCNGVSWPHGGSRFFQRLYNVIVQHNQRDRKPTSYLDSSRFNSAAASSGSTGLEANNTHWVQLLYALQYLRSYHVR